MLSRGLSRATPWYVYTLPMLCLLASCGPRRTQLPRPADALLSDEISATAETASRHESSPIIREGDCPSWMASRSKSSSGSVRFLSDDDAATKPTWSAHIPGRGHSTPIVVDDQIFVTSADETARRQLVICFDRLSGKQLWSTNVLQAGFPKPDAIHQDASHASPTPTADQTRLFAVFLNDNRIVATALDFTGNVLWQKPAGSFRPDMGYASSPAIWGERLIIAADDSDGGFISALERSTGEVLWRKARSKGASHSSPTVMTLRGDDQIVLTGLNSTSAYSPRDGSELWRIEGPADTTVATGVTDGEHVFVSGGYPQQGVICAKVSRSPTGWAAHIDWSDKSKVYVPSLLLTQAGLLGIADNGVALLWATEDGELLQRLRLGGDIYASPVQHGDFIYVASRAGDLHVLKLDGRRVQVDMTHHFDGEIMATPVVSDRELLLRVAENRQGQRQEVLYSFRGNTP